MADPSKARKQAQLEALELSGEILKNLELSELPLSSVALKASRLARLMGDPDSQEMFACEAGGYSTGDKAIPANRYQQALRAGRRSMGWDSMGRMSNDMVWVESIEALEEQLQAAKVSLANLKETNRPTPTGYVLTPATERGLAQGTISRIADRLASRRKLIYDYALAIHYELRYSGIAEDVFARLRDRVDGMIGQAVPKAVQKLASVYENLDSDNAEDWANAVHSCRRLLQDLADALFPATPEIRTIQRDGREVQIKYGPDQYINRLIRFIEEHATSKRFTAIVGSHLAYIGDRLDAVFDAAQKGSHATVTREEADRFVIYTYLLVGDILSLAREDPLGSTA